jgi:PAS domain-containing protein
VELLGKSDEELFSSEFAKSTVADDMRVMKEGKGSTIEEELNGRFYSTTKFPILIDGNPRYLAGYIIDITERKRTEAQIRDLFFAVVFFWPLGPVWGQKSPSRVV